MTKEIWLNIPVKDVHKSKAFFTALGYTFNSPRDNDSMVCLQIGNKNFVLMLVAEHLFKTFIQGDISDTTIGSEFLISIDAETREEVDALAVKVEEAGSMLYSKPMENQGWMYGFGFKDLDGHKWNVLYMDTSNMP